MLLLLLWVGKLLLPVVVRGVVLGATMAAMVIHLYLVFDR
jgi:hypothetical protein